MADWSVYGYTWEGLLTLAGLFPLWHLALSPRARATPAPRRLTAWPGQASDLLLCLIFAISGAIVLPTAVNVALNHTSVALINRQMWATLAFQGGMLLGIALYWRLVNRAPVISVVTPARPFRTGAATFLVALPLVVVVSFAWQFLLEAVGFTVRKQDAVDLFQDLHSPAMKILFVVVAAGVAPLTEELIFRAGIFRFLRGRIPRKWAVFISALLFGAMHLIEAPLDGLGAFVPLVVLGAVFALAYERTGRLSTTIVAHALFNLNTLLALVCGVNS